MTSVAPSFTALPQSSSPLNGTPLMSFGTPSANAMDMLNQRATTVLMGELVEALQASDCITDATIEVAVDELLRLHSAANKLGGWSTPHITTTLQGEVVLEWWKDNRKLTVYLHQDEREFIKVWGADMETEMESGSIDHWSFISAWRWLQG